MQLLTIIAFQDPKLASEWIPIAEADGIDTRTFASRIAGSWAHRDPLGAIAWIETLPPGDEREKALQRAGRRWNDDAPNEFASWLEEQGDDAWVDGFRQTSIHSAVYRAKAEPDWSELMRRADQIVDDKKRARQRVWVLQFWFAAQPAEADAWIDAHRDEMTEREIASAHELSMGDRRLLEKILGKE